MITKNDQKFYREQNLKNTNLHAPQTYLNLQLETTDVFNSLNQ